VPSPFWSGDVNGDFVQRSKPSNFYEIVSDDDAVIEKDSSRGARRCHVLWHIVTKLGVATREKIARCPEVCVQSFAMRSIL